MSSFQCEYCQALILDTSEGYVTSCPHYPDKPMTAGEYAEHKRWLATLETK